jgi:N-acetylmuramoyl-L-alanine amidase
MPNRRPVIVIDPGHGGREKIGGSSPNNAAGANGMLEKNLTLDIALRMASVLKDSARVLLTRNDDFNLSLAERANLARRNDAAIFLSLHFNGFKDRNVDGAEVFVASRAGASSERLARLVLDHLVNVTSGANRGVKRADLGVLLPDRHLTQTAACLAEIAFLTNPAQAKNLEDAAYRQRIAAALGDAILKSLSSSSFSLQSLPFDYKNGHSDSRYFHPPDYYALDGGPKFDIKGSVGKGGANKPDDILAVKRRLIELGFDWITPDKKMDAETIHAIRLFQSIVNDSKTLSGDGKIDVGANTCKWLQAVNAPRWRKMPKGSAGEGFVNFEYDDENIHIYGTDWLADTLAGAGIHYRNNYLKSHPTAALLTVNDASLARGGNAPPHSEHQTGMDCDLRLPRTDGKTGGINIGKPAELLLFDRNAARAILQALKAQPLVSRLLFNDQTLIDEGLCKKSTPDHNHHIHVDISPPARMNDLKHYRSGGRLYQGSHQDDVDYQTHALDANCDNSAGVKRDEKYLEFAPMSRESDRPNKKENVFLRWCDIPKNRCEVDVVVHFHGWDIRSAKTAFFEFAVKNSGLDLLKPDGTLTRQRPTLCILPFGKGEKMSDPKDDRIQYTFPFFTGKNDGLQQLIDFSLKYLAGRYKSAFTIGRLILTAHSGGGAAVSSILQKLANGSLVLKKKDFDEIHLFDSTYGDQQSFIDWATNKINASETSAKSGALRVIYQPFDRKCNESGTAAGSRQIEKGISGKTSKYPTLNSRYRVQPTRIEHLSIPKTFGFQLLANASADLNDSFVNKDSVHPCCQKSPAKCGVKEPARQQSLSFERRGISPGMRMTAGLDAGAGRDLGYARAMDAPKPVSAPTFIEENLLKDHPLSTSLIVVASKKGKKGSKANVVIKESPSVFVPQILRLAAKMASDEKRADLAAQLAPDQWFTRFTRSIALPGGKTADLTFLGRKLKHDQYIHIELAKTLQRIEDRFVQELKSTAEDAGDILLKKSDEGISGTRAKSSTAKYSYHMFGLAVDVNYLGNPFIQSGAVETVNNVLRNAASLMNTDALSYATNAKGKFKDRFDYIQAMDSLLEQYFGLLDDQTGLERYRSGSSEWRTLSIEATKKKIQTDLDVLSGALERGDTKDYKRKDYFKNHAILNFDKRFVLGMEQMGLYWGGHYGDMMHFDLRSTGVGDYVRRGISQYQKSVDSLAGSLLSDGKSGAYRSDGQPA